MSPDPHYLYALPGTLAEARPEDHLMVGPFPSEASALAFGEGMSCIGFHEVYPESAVQDDPHLRGLPHPTVFEFLEG